MKYSVLVNQKAIEENSSGLDIVDAALLDFLVAFCAPDNKALKQMNFDEGGRSYRYTWVNYANLLAEMPLLRIKSKSVVSVRLQKLEKQGFVKTFRAPDRTMYVRITEKCHILFFDKGVRFNEREKSRGVRLDERGVRLDEQHNQTISNQTIKRTAADKPPRSVKEIDDSTPMNLKDFVSWMRKSPQRHIQIIADYAEAKEPGFQTKGQWASFRNRHLRVARRLSPFTDGQIEEAAQRVHGADWMRRWTLETVEKFLIR